MKYSKIAEAEFVSRPNRFVANVLVGGEPCVAHVKNTGRCRELLLPGATVYLEDFRENPGKRKLLFSLVAVKKSVHDGELLINMDSQAPNKVVFEALHNGDILLPGMGKLKTIKPEAVFGDSRLDFYIEDENGQKGCIEVKGVTLEENGIASFPDAPTQRGVKHIGELIRLKESGYQAFILFVIQMKGMKLFTPNAENHPEFANALKAAQEKGVCVLAYDCKVAQHELWIDEPVKIKL